jgi:hypothetical protein
MSRVQVAAQTGVPIPLGQGAIVPGSVTSLEGLVSGRDFTVDAAGGTVTLSTAAGRALLTFDFEPVVPPPPLPPAAPTPDFGADLPADYAQQLADGVAQLRAYLALSSPLPAQSTAALKLLIRVLFFLLRRWGG